MMQCSSSAGRVRMQSFQCKGGDPGEDAGAVKA